MNEAVEQLTIHELPLAELHRATGATFAERDGWLLPANYGDTRAEYEAVRGVATCGLIDFSARGRIELSGAEAVQFLNGLITNDVKTLAAGAWMHAAFPNVQGRLLASVRIARPGDEVKFLIDTEAATHGKVYKLLERFTLAGDFRVTDVTAQTVQLSLQGTGAHDLIELMGDSSLGQLSSGTAAVVNWQGSCPVTVLCDPHTGDPGFDLICPTEGAAELWKALIKAGARPVGFDAFEVLRVEAGVPRYGVDVDETNVVSEAVREDEAVSYTKGCYIGQEIIARIHWRGHVAKRLAGLILEDEGELDATGAKVRTAEGKEIGRVTSSVFSPRLGRRIALGVIKYDYLQPDTPVSVVSGDDEVRAARIATLPFRDGNGNAASAPAGDKEMNGAEEEADG